MADPKKPAPDEPIPPGQMTYPTPELDPKTGAPLDTRFPPAQDASQEAADQQPPKSPEPEEDADEDDDDETPKGKEKPKGRR